MLWKSIPKLPAVIMKSVHKNADPHLKLVHAVSGCLQYSLKAICMHGFSQEMQYTHK